VELKKRWVHALVAFCLITVYTARPAWPWETMAVDDGPVIGPSSLAVDGSDLVHIVYRDESSLELKYTTNATGSWVSTLIEPPLAVDDPSVAVDSEHHVHIVCETDEQEIKYLTNASGSWTVTDIGVGINPSIAVDPSGHVHLCYLSSSLDHGSVLYATNRSGDWIGEGITPDLDFFEHLYGRTSIALDSAGNAYLSYTTSEELPGSGDEYYATNASGSWVETPLPLLDLGAVVLSAAFSPCIAIDASDRLHITYFLLSAVGDFQGIFLGHTTNTSGKMRAGIVGWKSEMYSPYSTSMVADRANAVHVSYSYDLEAGVTRLLKYARYVHGNWAVSRPLSDRVSRWDEPSIGVDVSGKVYISYTDLDNRLLVISGMADDLSPSWPGTPAEASAYGQTSRAGSSLFNNFIILLAPVGAVLFLRVLRRRK